MMSGTEEGRELESKLCNRGGGGGGLRNKTNKLKRYFIIKVLRICWGPGFTLSMFTHVSLKVPKTSRLSLLIMTNF